MYRPDNDADPARLSELRPALLGAGYDTPLTYRELWESAVNGALPGTFQIRNRWFFRRGAVPDIAAALRLERSAADDAGAEVTA